MPARFGFQSLPLDGATPRQTAVVVNSLREGKVNSIIDPKLDTGATSTSISFALASPFSFVDIMPIPGTAYTAEMASAVAAGEIFVSTLNKGTIILTHGTYSDSRSIRIIVLG